MSKIFIFWITRKYSNFIKTIVLKVFFEKIVSMLEKLKAYHSKNETFTSTKGIVLQSPSSYKYCVNKTYYLRNDSKLNMG